MFNSCEPVGTPPRRAPEKKSVIKRNIKLLSYQKCPSLGGSLPFKAADMNENNLFHTMKLQFTWNFAQLSQHCSNEFQSGLLA